MVAAVLGIYAVDEHSWFYFDGFDENLLAGKCFRLEDDVQLATWARRFWTALQQPFDVMNVVGVPIQVDVAAPCSEGESVWGGNTAFPAQFWELLVSEDRFPDCVCRIKYGFWDRDDLA